MDGREDNVDTLGQPSATPETASTAPEMASQAPVAPAEGGIFSGEDTRVETENLPAVPEVVQQAPASSISPTLRTTSTVTGDLQLGDNTKKKKWPFIALGAVATIALVVGGWTLLRSQNSEYRTYRKAKNTFLEYANFVLHGRASTDALDTSCMTDRSCYFLQAMHDKDQSGAFFEESAAAKAKLNEAVNAWANNLAAGDKVSEDRVDSTVIAKKIQELVDLHEFLDVYQSRGMLKKSDIVNYFLTNGDAGIQDYIANYYGSGHDGNVYLNDLRENVSAMSEAVLANIEIYAQHGCMIGLMNEACFAASATEEEKMLVAENNQIIADYGIEMDTYTDTPYGLLNDIVKINNFLNLHEQAEQE